MKKIIEAKNICKSFGNKDNRTKVLKNVSLDIYENDYISIMGPSGSGKSTLLFSISGMDSVDSGEIFFLEKSLTLLNDEQISDIRRKEMGFVFQNPTMLSNLDILDNIILPNFEEKEIDKKEFLNNAMETMKTVGIDGLENRSITQVSGGQLQRAAICRAILHKPKILFGDEPTGALNSRATDEILKLFENLNNNGMTILIVTHDPKVASRTKRVLFMKDGQLESQIKFTNENQSKRFNLLNEKMLNLGI